MAASKMKRKESEAELRPLHGELVARQVFPYLGWLMLGWFLTLAAVELGMMQRLLVVLALSLIAPDFVAIDKAMQLRGRER